MCYTALKLLKLNFSYNQLSIIHPVQVCFGDRIVVDVHNELDTDAESIHWHGMGE